MNQTERLNQHKATIDEKEQAVKKFTTKMETWVREPYIAATFSRMFGSKEESLGFFSHVISAVRANPDLEIKGNWESFKLAIQNCAAMKLTPAKGFGEVDFVLYKTEVVAQVGYQGLVKLAYRGGYVTKIWGEVVYSSDLFDYELGLEKNLRHKRGPGGLEDRGERTHAYVCFKNIYGEVDFFVMAVADILKIKERSPAARFPQSPWNSKHEHDQNWMYLKTVLKQALKLQPKSPEIVRVVDFDTYLEQGDRQLDLSKDDGSGARRIPALETSTTPQAAPKTPPQQQQQQPRPLPEKTGTTVQEVVDTNTGEVVEVPPMPEYEAVPVITEHVTHPKLEAQPQRSVIKQGRSLPESNNF